MTKEQLRKDEHDAYGFYRFVADMSNPVGLQNSSAVTSARSAWIAASDALLKEVQNEVHGHNRNP